MNIFQLTEELQSSYQNFGNMYIRRNSIEVGEGRIGSFKLRRAKSNHENLEET